MGAASQSVRNTIEKINQEINDKILILANDLFNGIVDSTPVGSAPIDDHPGLLKNNWIAMDGDFSSSTNPSEDPSGSGSYLSISSLAQSEPFKYKDGRITLTNNISYVYNAEVLGWLPPQWSGGTGPYRMVATNFMRVIAKDYK